MRAWMLMAAVAALVVAGCGKGEEAPAEAAQPAAEAPTEVVNVLDAGPPGDPKAGAEIFQNNCVACHQKDGTGMGGALAANFNEPGRLAKPDSVLLHSIAEGYKGKTNVMPAQKGLLTEAQRKDALAYIRATFGPDKK